MPKYQVRYKYNQGPEGSDDVVVVEAAMFATEGKFVDFYSGAVEPQAGGVMVPTGNVVYRVAEDILADVKYMSE
jgi:hypothetical protein